MKLEVGGKFYTVIETLPYHGAGRKAKVVKVEGKEKVAVMENGKWRFWTARDRLKRE